MNGSVKLVSEENLATTVKSPEVTVNVEPSCFKCHGDRIEETTSEVNRVATLILIQVTVKVKGVGPVPYSLEFYLHISFVLYCGDRIQEDLEKVKHFIPTPDSSILRLRYTRSSRRCNLAGL